jgi:hypothetical protein
VKEMYRRNRLGAQQQQIRNNITGTQKSNYIEIYTAHTPTRVDRWRKPQGEEFARAHVLSHTSVCSFLFIVHTHNSRGERPPLFILSLRRRRRRFPANLRATYFLFCSPLFFASSYSVINVRHSPRCYRAFAYNHIIILPPPWL